MSLSLPAAAPGKLLRWAVDGSLESVTVSELLDQLASGGPVAGQTWWLDTSALGASLDHAAGASSLAGITVTAATNITTSLAQQAATGVAASVTVAAGAHPGLSQVTASGAAVGVSVSAGAGTLTSLAQTTATGSAATITPAGAAQLSLAQTTASGAAIGVGVGTGSSIQTSLVQTAATGVAAGVSITGAAQLSLAQTTASGAAVGVGIGAAISVLTSLAQTAATGVAAGVTAKGSALTSTAQTAATASAAGVTVLPTVGTSLAQQAATGVAAVVAAGGITMTAPASGATVSSPVTFSGTALPNSTIVLNNSVAVATSVAQTTATGVAAGVTVAAGAHPGLAQTTATGVAAGVTVAAGAHPGLAQTTATGVAAGVTATGAAADTTAPVAGTLTVPNGTAGTAMTTINPGTCTDAVGIVGWMIKDAATDSFTAPVAGDSGWTAITYTTSWAPGAALSYTPATAGAPRYFRLYCKDSAGNVGASATASATVSANVVTFVGAGANTYIASTTGSDTMPAPAGIQAGDILVAIYNGNSGAPPSGFTNKVFGTYSLSWKRATGSETNIPCGAVSGVLYGSRIFAFRGCASSGDPFDAVGSMLNASAATTVTGGALTTAANGSMIGLIFRDTTTGSDANGAGGAATNFNSGGTAAGANYHIAYGVADTAGTQAAPTLSLSAAGTGRYCTFALLRG